MTSRSADVAPLTKDEEAFLRAFGRACLVLPREFDADLQREQHMSWSEYQTLVHLSEAPDRRLRMSDLAAVCALSSSGVSRVVDRLQGAGLVHRERCSADARGWHAVLTAAGSSRLAQSWPTHVASVRRHFFDHLTGVDLCPITDALRKLAADSDQDTAGQRPTA